MKINKTTFIIKNTIQYNKTLDSAVFLVASGKYCEKIRKKLNITNIFNDLTHFYTNTYIYNK